LLPRDSTRKKEDVSSGREDFGQDGFVHGSAFSSELLATFGTFAVQADRQIVDAKIVLRS